MSQKAIPVSGFNSVLTISFLNKSHVPPSPVVWVAENQAAFDKALDSLKSKKHIEITGRGPSHVTFEDSWE